MSPIRPDYYSRHRSCPADRICSRLQHREFSGHVIVHQGAAQIGFLQSTVQNNAAGNACQFYDGCAYHERNISGARQGDERFGINAARIGDCAAGCRDCHIRYIVLVPEGIAPEIHSEGTVRIAPEHLLKRDLVCNPGVVVPSGPVGEGHRSFSLQPCGDHGDLCRISNEAGCCQDHIVIDVITFELCQASWPARDIGLLAPLQRNGDGRWFRNMDAFKGCTGLKDISIPGETTFIGESAFEGCTNLKTVILWGDPTSIEKNTFKNCSKAPSSCIV